MARYGKAFSGGEAAILAIAGCATPGPGGIPPPIEAIAAQNETRWWSQPDPRRFENSPKVRNSKTLEFGWILKPLALVCNRPTASKTLHAVTKVAASEYVPAKIRRWSEARKKATPWRNPTSAWLWLRKC